MVTLYSSEAEAAIASIALSHPERYFSIASELRFNARFMHTPLNRAIVEVCEQLVGMGESCNSLIVYEHLHSKPEWSELRPFQINEIEYHHPIISSLKPMAVKVKELAAKRNAIAELELITKRIHEPDSETREVLSNAMLVFEDLSSESKQYKAKGLTDLLSDALNRYSNGEDQSTRVRTGFANIDALVPIKSGDFVVVGGETKAGKTTWCLNVVANLIVRM